MQPFFEAWVAALEERDINAYAALLEESPVGFRLGMIGHLSDPDFISAEVGWPVSSVLSRVSILGQRVLGDGEIEVETSFQVYVRAGGTMASAVRLVHVLARDRHGFLRIRAQREYPGSGTVTWGSLKSFYR